MFIFRKLADEGKQQEESKIIYNVIIKEKFLNRDFSVLALWCFTLFTDCIANVNTVKCFLQ